MKGYKAFNKGLICKGKQYKEHTVFEENEAILCERGMHFCKNPLNVLNYYPLLDHNNELCDFAEVESLTEAQTNDNIKYCTTKLRIGSKLDLNSFIAAAIRYLSSIATIKRKVTINDNLGKLASLTDGSNLIASGDNSQIVSGGLYSNLTSSGDNSRLVSSGSDSKLTSSGRRSILISNGGCSVLTASGRHSQLVSSGGGSSSLTASGHNSQLLATGIYSQLTASGLYAKLTSKGNRSRLATTGHYSTLTATGDYSSLMSSGLHSALSASGTGSIIAGIGIRNIAKGKKGCWIILAEWGEDNKTRMPVIKCVKAKKIDGKTIKEDTFYKLENGKFIEV